jgi:hypothetical protein
MNAMILEQTLGSGTGALSVRIHSGSYPNDVGSVGTNDPAIWRHLLWFDGEIWAAELLSDALNHVPTYEELRSHFDDWNGSSQSCWRKVKLEGAKLLTG